MNDHVPAPYGGLDRFEARKRVLADLKKQELLVSEKPHRLKVPRSGALAPSSSRCSPTSGS